MKGNGGKGEKATGKGNGGKGEKAAGKGKGGKGEIAVDKEQFLRMERKLRINGSG